MGLKGWSLGLIFLYFSLLGLAGCSPSQGKISATATPALGDLVATAVQATTLHSGAATPTSRPPGVTRTSPTSTKATEPVNSSQTAPVAQATPLSITLTPWPTHTLLPGGIVTATATPITSCPGAPAIRLAIGKTAMVSLDPPVPSRVREQPGLTGRLLGQINPGEKVTILEGPRCVSSLTWWKVQSTTGLVGWTAEGDMTAYWLVP